MLRIRTVLRYVLSCCLHVVVGAEERSGMDGVHGAKFQVDEDGTGNELTAVRLPLVSIDTER